MLQRTRELVRIDDTATEGRWPRWAEAVQPLGVRSALSAPLLAVEETIGAMQVYSEALSAYGPREEQVMRLLAAQAAILLANSQSLRAARRLSRRAADALASRDVIAQATGVLLGRGAPDARNAFTNLAQATRRAHRPVEGVARALLAEVSDGPSGILAP